METPPPPQPPTPGPDPSPQPHYAPPGGPTIRFDIIGQAFQMVFADLGTWALASLCVIVVVGAVSAVVYLIALGVLMKAGLFGMLAAQGALGFVVGSLVNLMMANMYRMVILSLQGQKPMVSEMFKFDSNTTNILIGSFIVGFAVAIGEMFCYIPGLVIGGLTMFTLPILVDRKLDAMAAITLSIETLKKDWLLAALFYLVISICAGLGAIACVIGVILTLAVLPFGVSMLYRDYLGFQSAVQDR